MKFEITVREGLGIFWVFPLWIMWALMWLGLIIFTDGEWYVHLYGVLVYVIVYVPALIKIKRTHYKPKENKQ